MSEDLWEKYISEAEAGLLSPNTDGDHRSHDDRMMTSSDISEFMEATAQAHGYAVGDISYYFEPIFEDNKLSLTHLKLIFTHESLVDYEVGRRIIHTLTVRIPQEVAESARIMMTKEHK